MTTRVFVVRHGQTYGNIEGLFCGHSETDLTPLGVAQAKALGRRLAGTDFDGVYSSDLSRAVKTGEHALEALVAPTMQLDQRLREMYYGDWEARPGSEIGEQYPALMRDFFLCRATAPGGEGFEAIRTRTTEAVRDAVTAHRGGTVMVVSHGNAIMAMLAEFFGLPIAATWSFAVDNTSLTRLQFSKSGRFTLLGFNDHAHTEGLAGPTG